MARETGDISQTGETHPQGEETAEADPTPPIRDWHSSPLLIHNTPPALSPAPLLPKTHTPPPPPMITQPLPPLPPRTPKRPGESSHTTRQTPNPAVADPNKVPNFFTIETFANTQEIAETPKGTRPPQGIAQDLASQMVMVHPEVPNPQLNLVELKNPQMDDTGVDTLLCVTEQEVESSPLPAVSQQFNGGRGGGVELRCSARGAFPEGQSLMRGRSRCMRGSNDSEVMGIGPTGKGSSEARIKAKAKRPPGSRRISRLHPRSLSESVSGTRPTQQP
ncbi:hypothetical protein Baya_16539 [Bagarius yarrelli]|uniref:Uncharacterized protein n=1 Tax=Bagarius yarrelli TaxID=175774 RepID=A0A556VWD5_BAGYA|nr:hypothetical protein Baya_16539 [Bagarius yarrelli]